MNRKLLIASAIVLIFGPAILFHKLECDERDSAEPRLIIGTCIPQVYDPDRILMQLESELSESEDLKQMQEEWRRLSKDRK